MAFDRWRIGVDMEPDVLRALALSRDRAEWRCCGWWQFPLPMAQPLDFVFRAEPAASSPLPVAADVSAYWRACRLLAPAASGAGNKSG